jgi:tRNA nucleotidyltransferase (CCA-adding enzyme)
VSPWRHFPHEADVGVRGEGATMAEAFEQGALAVTAAVTDPQAVSLREAVEIACEAEDPEVLFADWLNAVVYEMATRHMLFGRFDVTLTGGRLQATAWGEPVDVARHQPAVEVKGATYAALKVARGENGRWTAQCVVDV